MAGGVSGRGANRGAGIVQDWAGLCRFVHWAARSSFVRTKPMVLIINDLQAVAPIPALADCVRPRHMGIFGKRPISGKCFDLWLGIGFSKSFGNGRVAINGARASFVPTLR